MTQIRKFTSLLVVAAGIALLTGGVWAQETALIRFVHLDARGGIVDIALNGELAAADLRYAEATARIEVAAGPTELSTYPPATSLALARERITLAGEPAAIVLTDGQRARFHIVSEDLSPIPSGKARLTLFNALDADIQVAVSTPDETSALDINLAAGGASQAIETSAGTYDILLRSAGDGMALGGVSQPWSAGSVNLLIIHGPSNQPKLFNAVAGTGGVADSGRTRFIHAIEGAAPVDLRVNGQLLIPALSFASPSPHIALPSGSQNIAVNLGAAEIMSERLWIRAGEMSTVVLMRTSAGLGIFNFADATDDVDERSAVVSLINAIPDSVINYLQFTSGAIIGLNVQFNEAGDPAKIVPGRQAMTLHLSIGANRGEIALPAHYFSNGSYYTLVALPGGVFSAPRLLIAETSMKRHIRATLAGEDIASDIVDARAPDIEQSTDESAADEPIIEPATQVEELEPDTVIVDEEIIDEPPTEQVAEVSEQEPSPGDAPTALSPSLTPYAIVKVNPDSALHMRQYPSSDAMSLGLLPAESNLMILGRRGPSQFGPDEPTDLPVDLSDYQKDAAALLPPYQDLSAADTWLYAIYTTPEGSAIVGWTNAYYLKVYNRTGDHQHLAYLPLVPQNRPGGSHSTDIQPTDLDEYVAARVTGLNPDALLNLRRGNDADSDILALLSADTTLRFLGLDAAAAWALVEYQPLAGNPMRGWVSMTYIQLLLNGAPVRVDALRTLDPSAVPIIGGAVSGGVLPATPTSPDTPLEGIVGEVNVNSDSALHLRRYPDAASESLALIPPDTVLRLEGITENRGWYKVQYQGEEGWVASPYLLLSMDGRSYTRALLEDKLPRYNDLGF